MGSLNKKYKDFIAWGVILFVCLLVFCIPAKAETVSQKEASRLAQLFFNAANGKVMMKPSLVYNGKRLTTDRLFSPFYVYNLPAGGFVIISAENKAFPILGYSLKDNFDPDRLGESERALLRSYARDIEAIRYDDRVPEDAVLAWQNYSEYVDGLLKAAYYATDPVFTTEEVKDKISSLSEEGILEDYSSDIYAPSQWEEIIRKELSDNRSVGLGIADGKTIRPGVVHGRKGDYFRIELDGRNNWLMRLFATEILSGGQIAMSEFAVPAERDEEEEPPFLFHDGFIEETMSEERDRLAALEEIINPSVPVIRGIGGGRFEIRFPEPIRLVRIFNVGGMNVARNTYSGQDTVVIDISHEPGGFYFGSFMADSGKTYGLKLYR